MGEKIVPNGDVAFKTMAEAFARVIAADPARFAVEPGDAEALSAAVARYAEALLLSQGGASRSPAATRAKDASRAEAERLVRRIAHRVRINDRVPAEAKFALNLRERPARATRQTCPQEPPRLRFVRALHQGNGATPMHELTFRAIGATSSAKPAGAVRLELFVDLVPPDEPIPARPGANHGGRPWYLRSFTRSPIVIAPPMARVPMRVVYWGRWADSTGNVGPFSATAVAWIEGGSHHFLPGGQFVTRNAPPLLEDATAPGPAERDPTYSVAVLDAQYETLNAAAVAPPALPAPAGREPRQLEGPAASEAA